MGSDNPIPRSSRILGLEWLTDRIAYPDMSVTGDTYPLTWADDDSIYTSAGDPMWYGLSKDEGLDVERIAGGPHDVSITRVNDMYDYRGFGGKGPKPSGMICVGGVLYLAVQNLKGKKPPAHGDRCQHGSDAHIIISKDYGKTWSPRWAEIKRPMFPGHLFGSPSFVNYGKNHRGATDGYIYAVSGDQWDNGSELRLGRVPKDRISEKRAWEYVSGLSGDHQPNWSRSLNRSAPILVWDRHISLPEMVYIAGLERYILLTWRLNKDFSPEGTQLIILEAPAPWGPFSLVCIEDWEDAVRTPYCPRIPLKWMAPDGQSGWLLFSGSWQSPDDRGWSYRPYYRVNLRQFRFKLC